MVKPSVDAIVSPEELNGLEFTRVECLLIAYHAIGKQLPEDYYKKPEKEEEWTDFKV